MPVHAAKSRQTKRRWDDVEPIIGAPSSSPVLRNIVFGEVMRTSEFKFTLMVYYSENGGLMDMEQDEMVMLVPKLFSTKDMPDEIL